MPMTAVESASTADKGSMLQCGKGSSEQSLPNTEYKPFPVSPTQLLTPLQPQTRH